MAAGDVKILNYGAFGSVGTRQFSVASGAAASINPGEFVLKPLGNSTGNVVAKMATNKPVVATDFLGGLATSTSTDTAAAAGKVDVMPILPGMEFLIAPKVAASWNTQALYDALVGARVLIDVTAGVHTILATDGATNGCVVEPLDISKYPGLVAFSIRQAANYFA